MDFQAPNTQNTGINKPRVSQLKYTGGEDQKRFRGQPPERGPQNAP